MVVPEGAVVICTFGAVVSGGVNIQLTNEPLARVPRPVGAEHGESVRPPA